MKKNYLIVMMLFVSVIGLSQTREQVAKFTKENNNQKLAEIKQRSLAEQKKTERKALIENIPLIIVDDEGNRSVLHAFDPNGDPIYVTNTNVDAAISTRTNFLHPGGGLDLNLEGANMTAHVWEVGSPRLTHQEFDGPGGTDRVSQIDNFNFVSDHANHVIGTILAAGIHPDAKGMAPRARVELYTSFGDASEATDAAINGMLISNHSYSRNIQSGVNADVFGSYNADAKEWDEIMYNAPYYLQLKSAGNNGQDNNLNSQPLNGNSNYDKLMDEANSKNNLVIANFFDMQVDENGVITSAMLRNPFSSEGPTDDLRIKPDLAGNGNELFSPISSADDAYGIFSGTSMSSPNVAGSLLLLQEHYQNTTGNFMRAATLKGLALHTADDAFPQGPDALSGWGVLNSKKAAETITNAGTTAVIEEIELYNSQTYTIEVIASGLEDLLASISWTDVAGPRLRGVNNTTAALVNDLDIRVSQNGTVYEPYKLLSEDTNGTGDNDRDPFERIDITNASGTYTITVSHKGALVNDYQNFSLILTGIEAVVTPGEISVAEITEYPYFQSFENGFAGWSNEDECDLQWILNSGPTPDPNTRPDAASDGDYYMFAEMTGGNTSSCYAATLYSPIFVMDGVENASITFSYHQLYPNYTAGIELEMEVAEDHWVLLWYSYTENSDDVWKTVTVDFSSWLGYAEAPRLRFSRYSNSSDADLAIDDIVVNIGAASVPQPEGYCDVVFVPEEGDENIYEWIGQVRLGNIRNPSGPGLDENGYSDYTGIKEPFEVLEPGTNRNIILVPKWLDEQYPEDYAVYIDYNRDGDFDDANELVYDSFFNQLSYIVGNFTVPQDIGFGKTRMRVIMHWDIIEGPCGPFQYGEAEDYIVALNGAITQSTNNKYSPTTGANGGYSEIALYPNPVNGGVLNVKVLDKSVMGYSIYNTVGQVITSGAYSEQIDVSGLADGLYILELNTPSKVFVERFIKQ